MIWKLLAKVQWYYLVMGFLILIILGLASFTIHTNNKIDALQKTIIVQQQSINTLKATIDELNQSLIKAKEAINASVETANNLNHDLDTINSNYNTVNEKLYSNINAILNDKDSYTLENKVDTPSQVTTKTVETQTYSKKVQTTKVRHLTTAAARRVSNIVVNSMWEAYCVNRQCSE